MNKLRKNYFEWSYLFVTVFFAIVLLVKPDFFHQAPDPKSADYLIQVLLDPVWHAYGFLALALVEFIGLSLKQRYMHFYGLLGLELLYTLSAVALTYQFWRGVPTESFVLSCAMLLFGWGVALKGDFNHVG